MRKILILITVACFLCVSSIACAAEDTSKALKTVIMENLQSVQDENIDQMIKTIHTQSPGYLKTTSHINSRFVMARSLKPE